MGRIWIVLTFIVFCCAKCTQAQVYVGAGGQLDIPLLYNSNVGSYNHSLGAFGPRLSFSYIPQNTLFYPSFTLNSTSLLLPLVKAGDVVVNMQFLQVNATLWANIKKQLSKNELHYGIGIGASYFHGRHTDLDGAIDNVTGFTDSPPYIDTWMPSFNGRAEYIFPMSSEQPLYVGIGCKLQYIYFFDNDIKYNITITDQYKGAYLLQPELLGHLVNPGFYLSVYYRFGNTKY